VHKEPYDLFYLNFALFVSKKDFHVSALNEMTCCLLFVQPSASTVSNPAQQSQEASSNAPAPWLIMYPHLTVSIAKQHACVAFREAAMEAHGLSPASALHTLLRQGNDWKASSTDRLYLKQQHFF